MLYHLLRFIGVILCIPGFFVAAVGSIEGIVMLFTDSANAWQAFLMGGIGCVIVGVGLLIHAKADDFY